jgi:hypothetical protein
VLNAVVILNDSINLLASYICHGDGYSAFNRLVTLKIIYSSWVALPFNEKVKK